MGFKDLREKEKKHCEQEEERPGDDPWGPLSLVHVHLTCVIGFAWQESFEEVLSAREARGVKKQIGK